MNAQLDFEWDPDKAARNLRKHGVSFELAATVFLDPLSLSMEDDEHGFGERWITMGLSRENQLLVVIHTFEEEAGNRANVRIISARNATRRERRLYEDGA